MIRIPSDGWRFALSVDLQRVFGYRVQIGAEPDDINALYAATVHLVRAFDPAGRRLANLGVYDRRDLARRLARLPNEAWTRGDALAEIAPARLAPAAIR